MEQTVTEYINYELGQLPEDDRAFLRKEASKIIRMTNLQKVQLTYLLMVENISLLKELNRERKKIGLPAIQGLVLRINQ